MRTRNVKGRNPAREEMSTGKKIRRIIEFMNIPAFNQILSAKLLELEITLRPQIKHFQDLKAKFKEMAEAGMTVLENNAPVPAGCRAYNFELKRNRPRRFPLEGQWVLEAITPVPATPVPGRVLKELLQSMSCYGTDPARIHCKSLFYAGTGEYYDIHFTRYSEDYAFGVLRRSRRKEKASPGAATGNMLKLNLDYRESRKEDGYEELLRYLDEYPDLRERVFSYFYMMEKPAADEAGRADGLKGA